MRFPTISKASDQPAHMQSDQSLCYVRYDAYDTLGGTFISQRKGKKFRQVPQIKFFIHAVRRFMLEFIVIVFFFHANP